MPVPQNAEQLARAPVRVLVAERTAPLRQVGGEVVRVVVRRAAPVLEPASSLLCVPLDPLVADPAMTPYRAQSSDIVKRSLWASETNCRRSSTGAVSIQGIGRLAVSRDAVQLRRSPRSGLALNFIASRRSFNHSRPNCS